MGSYAAVVEKLRPEAGEPGEVVDEAGRVLGRHDGIIHFTIGQRKGLGIAAAEPLYVLRLDPETRRVVVGPRTALGAREVPLGDINWLGPLPAEGGAPVMIKLRSAQPPLPAMLSLDRHGGGRVVLDMPALGVAPGQACVAYDGSRMLGGGRILRTVAARTSPVTQASLAASA
jgi:tRNA-specific 2-thiouridylase